MTNKELLEEIRMNRVEIKKVEDQLVSMSQEFYIFKAKTVIVSGGVGVIVTIIINVGIALMK